MIKGNSSATVLHQIFHRHHIFSLPKPKPEVLFKVIYFLCRHAVKSSVADVGPSSRLVQVIFSLFNTLSKAISKAKLTDQKLDQRIKHRSKVRSKD